MSLRINSNPAAVNAYRNLTSTNVGLGKSLEKLSSGFRINRAADDAAGLVKSETLRAEISGNKAAIRNAQDGISFVQTAEGALNEVHSILQRMRELAVDAANTATTDGAAQQDEMTELLAELESIGTRTKFAGQDVFSNTTPAPMTAPSGRLFPKPVLFSSVTWCPCPSPWMIHVNSAAAGNKYIYVFPSGHIHVSDTTI